MGILLSLVMGHGKGEILGRGFTLSCRCGAAMSALAHEILSTMFVSMV